MKQEEAIKNMTRSDIKRLLLINQLLFIALAFGLSFLFFTDFSVWFDLFDWSIKEIMVYSIIPSILIISIDLVLTYLLPKHYYDDGGINERIFQSLTQVEIFFAAVFIAISEELLFRGVLQTTIGFVPASILFALIHIRYLKKPILLGYVLIVSFCLGYLFELTNNLLVTITIHFLIDFIMGLIIRSQKRGA
ncbi:MULTISPECIES: CPBP family intramembrane glutamic endopeptidase [unclassified Virgibacillus]|uniref:CPBP family intramembrane glutamic endopeptidase n=1 Tax=unclassified Virgibacillus TaxID=2620237 RepID=UPI0024DEA674|nr:CPBP family intramembrane glutamic endopeptidase [Virgibacillus sp. LDC-1]